MARLLVIGEDGEDCDAWIAILKTVGHDTRKVPGAQQGLEAVRSDLFDLVVITPHWDHNDLLGLLRCLRDTIASDRTLVVSECGTMETAVEAMKLGAVDYVRAPIEDGRYLDVIACALARVRECYATEPTESYAATRWAGAVAGLIRASRDARTLDDWGHEIGVASSTLRSWCRAANLSPKRSLSLARLLRAVYVARGQSWHPERLLNVTDRRTLEKLLSLGGLSSSVERVSIADVLARQQLIQDDSATRALSVTLLAAGQER